MGRGNNPRGAPEAEASLELPWMCTTAFLVEQQLVVELEEPCS